MYDDSEWAHEMSDQLEANRRDEDMAPEHPGGHSIKVPERIDEAHLVALYEAINLEEPDDLTVLDALKPIMPWASFVRLCEMGERCPIHVCDIQICRDDEVTECLEYQ